jgi:predicted metal-dependent phosphotriesterase family hydrolase
MTYLMKVFIPRLRRRLGEAAVSAILVDNPARAFAISPRAAGAG